MTYLHRILVLCSFLSIMDQGEGGEKEGGEGLMHHHHLHHYHHHYHNLQVLSRDSQLLDGLMTKHEENVEREKNLVLPPLPPPSPPRTHLKQHTWPRFTEPEYAGEGENAEGNNKGTKDDEFAKMRKEENKLWKRIKNRNRKLKRKMKEEMKRRKRQMRLTSKRKRENDQRPNIVIIMADDLGYNDVPWHNPDIRAPELLRLARHGVVLENHYVMPICTPSRAALLTGSYPFRYGKQASFSPLSPTGLNTSLTLLPQHLQHLGYKTHLVGKWHLGYCSWAYTPTHRGFDSFYGYYLGSQGYYNRYKRAKKPSTPTMVDEVSVEGGEGSVGSGGGDGGGVLKNFLSGAFLRGHGLLETSLPEGEETEGGYDFRLNETPLDNVTGIYSNDLYADRVEEVIRDHVRRRSSSPLFLMLALQATHGPLEAPPPGCRKGDASFSNIESPARRIFHAMVASMDCVVGRLVKQLRRSRLYHNTIIVFTSDNGGNFRIGGNNFPLRGNKGSLFEGGTRGVSFIHSPLLPNVGHRYRGLMHEVDWRATLLHAARGPAHWPSRRDWHGEEQEEMEKNEKERGVESSDDGDDSLNMWGALLHNNPSPRTSLIYNLRKGPLRGAIRRRHWKLVLGSAGPYDGWVPPGDVGGMPGMGGFSWHTRRPHVRFQQKDAKEILLFNLRDDPLETTDLSELYPDVVDSLRGKLRSYSAHSIHPHSPRDDPRGHPSLYGGFFSPGWCDPIV